MTTAHQIKMEMKRQGLWPVAQPQRATAGGMARQIGRLKRAMRRGELSPKAIVPSPLLKALMARAGIAPSTKPERKAA